MIYVIKETLNAKCHALLCNKRSPDSSSILCVSGHLEVFTGLFSVLYCVNTYLHIFTSKYDIFLLLIGRVFFFFCSSPD